MCAVVDAARMMELLIACEASRSEAEVKARNAAAAMQLAASHTKYDVLLQCVPLLRVRARFL